MNRQFQVIPVRKDPPDLERFVAALLALAMARVEAERNRNAAAPADSVDREGEDD